MITYPVVEAQPLRAQELIEAGWFVLDVRTDAEWAEGRIPGSTHMPLAEVVGGVGSRVIEPVLIVTADGGKGWRVAQYLKQEGIEVGNLVGGLFAWEAAGLPVER
ncbi:MAG: rhodanese-like domain-containing protein [Janthinobacterium lividum]